MKKAGPKGFVKIAKRRSAAGVALSTFVAVALFASALLVPLTTSQASNPGAGSLGPVTGTSATWRGTAPGGTSPEGQTTCVEGVNCDTYTLTLNGTPEQWAGKKVKVTIGWTLPASDYDLYIHKGSVTGPEVDNSGEAPPVISESAEIDPATAGTGVFAVRVVYWAAAGAADQYTGTASVENKHAGGAEPTPPPVSTAQPPAYQIHTPPANLGNGAGEPTIGLNWATGNAMFIAGLQTLKVGFDDANPAASTWTNVSARNTSVTSFDPILFTDWRTNRTFVSQLLPSKVSLMAFTDDDGKTWTPSQGSGINSGVDHQTVGGGPYARNADGSLKGGAIQRPGADLKIYPNAVYYASQDIGVAEIARSDDGGLTFGVAVPMYDITQCGGLHGHIKVAPDGTVYVPNKSCGGEQSVVVSEDNGLTWSVRRIPGSTSGRTDPSVGIGSDGTVYVGFANGDGTMRTAVSRDKGLTWEHTQDVGQQLGIKNSVFPAATAGDGDRAAVFFLGSTTGGAQGTGTDQTAPYFDGQWYGFIATTYDRGRSWVTVNATPNDPVQRGVVCTNGTTCPSGTRNLLDFNDMEVDKQGRVLAAFADGCVSASCVQGVDKDGDGRLTRFDNDGAEKATIIRQSGGLGLFAAFDPPTGGGGTEPVVTTTYINEDDARVEYSNGWHKEDNFAGASGGHFRHNNGKDAAHFARLNFEVEGETGAITLHYGTSQRGNSAEVILDGVSKGVVNFRGLTGGTRTPVFGPSASFDGLSRGQHTLELRAINGTVYVDGFTLKSATSSARPSSGPGQTTSGGGTAAAGGSLLSTVNVPEGAQAISVSVGTSLDVPVQVVLLDPNGLALATANGSNGVAVINRTVTQAGAYQLKVVNLGLGPVQVWTAATPLVAR
ncbi:MAG TPA: hypothetical protein VEY09_05855 [Pyrinomonadaceae bacterium]|nr:hypothetical protein [Pyrinomonadaceae bacterium]